MKNVFTFLFFCLSMQATAQYAIMGNVNDEQGNPLPGTTILIADSNRGAFSDADGFFIFTNVPKGTYELEISYVGFFSRKEKVEVTGKTVLNIVLQTAATKLSDVEVLSTWADEKTPMTYTNLGKNAIEKINLGQDVPILLQWTPSAVVTSDAGAGIGYTGIRIRGSDPTRINVTINGIPLNDAESQGVFWVDLPDFLSSTQQVQIQRGVGTSTNGAGAFGATINLNTAKVTTNPYVNLGGSIGSFNTWKSNVQFGTGLLGNKFTVDGRASYIHSDGYIDRAEANLQSGFLSLAYLNDRESLRLNVFSGHEITYQAWNGVPADLIEDRKTRTFNSAGTDDGKKTGAPHDNEVDDYMQSHLQLLYNRSFTKRLHLDAALHYTKGKGFFEQYKVEQLLSNYGLSPVPGEDTIYTSSDLIRRRWLDNDFYGMTFGLKYQREKLSLTVGGGQVIEGVHILPAQLGSRYYDNDATKQDANLFAKANYQLHKKLNAYLDLQQRYVSYDFLGVNPDGENLRQDVQLNFFNPKLGLLYQWDSQKQVYMSFAVANREPNRNDYTESPATDRPDPETLYNTELGYRLQKAKAYLSANLYHMQYKNQLVLTGELNDVGAATRVNVPDSYRLGMELDGQVPLTKSLSLLGNATLSRNKIKAFTEYADSYDADFNWIGQEAIERKNTDIASSPALMGSLGLNYAIVNDPDGRHFLEVGLQSKYVGQQYIDNSQEDNNRLDAFYFTDLRVGYQMKPVFAKKLSVTLLVNNLFNSLYETNAWSYRYFYDEAAELDQGFYPQAGTNFLLGVEIGF
jgi:iron complex outermembrane recepter protein